MENVVLTASASAVTTASHAHADLEDAILARLEKHTHSEERKTEVTAKSCCDCLRQIKTPV